MARFKGTFSVAANYEPLIAAPFDARQLVQTKLDLVDPATWQRANGDYWTYIGMMVVVAFDADEANNGLYILKADDFTVAENWLKCGTLPTATMDIFGGVKLSEDIGLNTDGQLKIKSISTDVLTNGNDELILDGGDAQNV